MVEIIHLPIFSDYLKKFLFLNTSPLAPSLLFYWLLLQCIFLVFCFPKDVFM